METCYQSIYAYYGLKREKKKNPKKQKKLHWLQPILFFLQAAETEKLWVLCFIGKPENIAAFVKT